MKKIAHTILRVLLGLLIASPILGALGIFPAPTPDLYNTPEAYNFIKSLYDGGYMMYMMAGVFFIALGLTITNRMALAALLILPISVNIIAFHAFLDGGLFTAGAIMGNVLFLITIYFMWVHRSQYKTLLEK
jgi:hypothetical protein